MTFYDAPKSIPVGFEGCKQWQHGSGKHSSARSRITRSTFITEPIDADQIIHACYATCVC